MSILKHISKLKEESHDDLCAYIKHHIKEIFNTHQLNKHYLLLHDVKTDDAYISLIIAWLALLSGDNTKSYQLYQSINQQELDDDMLLFYKSLESLASFILTEEERLTLSKETVRNIKNEQSFFAANAYLTHGQILAGYKKLNEAADMFEKAYDIFLKEHMLFPAVVSMTNALLNWFRLGDFKKVIQKAEKTMMILSSTKDQSSLYANIIGLPMGMSYVEEDKIELAIDYLLKSYASILELELIHMHGYVEIYLMRAYHLMDQKDQLSDMVNQAEKTFHHMHYPMMEVIVLYGKLLLNQLSPKDIQKLEAYDDSHQIFHPVFNEIMAVLYNRGDSKKLDINKFEKFIDDLRYEGDVVHLQKYLVLLAERYYVNEQPKFSLKILEEVVKLYKTYNLKSALFMYPLNCFHLITKIDPEIRLKTNQQELLTQREVEILNLIGQGKTNDDISNILFITVGTVKWHMNHILSKLDCKNRIQAYDKAKRLNLIK
ncbi:hypothetical protein BK010_09565 [Tenericutes bacterium MO-XQ]|nr:hypothetical protein BK010_09565 [Tenericutes bacterium MO-XQ]